MSDTELHLVVPSDHRGNYVTSAHWRRKRIEKDTKYHHALLEADADGDLILEDDNWRGDLNALCDGIEDITNSNAGATQRVLEEIKAGLDREIASFKAEVP